MITALVISSCNTSGESEEPICSKLSSYESMPFGDQSRRFVTLKWVGEWMDFDGGFGKSCQFSEDKESKDLCQWLTDNTSTEFPNDTPMSVLECYGYEFTSVGTWSGWKSYIDIWGDRDEPILLEVDFEHSSQKDPAIRITIFAEGHGSYDDDFIPLNNSKK